MFSRASRICCVGIWRKFSHLRLPLKWPNWISSVSMAPNNVSNLKLAISSRLTPISLRHSSKSPTQSENVPIFATLPGIVKSQHSEFSHLHLVRTGSPKAECQMVTAKCTLSSLKLRWTLLHVRGQTFFCVFALEQKLLIFALNGQS